MKIKQSEDFIYCECGCQKTLSKFGNNRTLKRYIKGHQNKNKRLKPQSFYEFIYCYCGCGKTRSKYKIRNGLELKCEPRFYIGGHQNIGKSKPSGINHYKWKGGKIFRRGYVYLLIHGYPNTEMGRYIREHRYIMEQYLGRLLRRDEDVHHKNGDKLDNRIENLEVMTKSQHTKHHIESNKYVKNQFGIYPLK